MTRTFVTLSALALLLSGCKAENKPKGKAAAPAKEPSTMSTMIDGMTGAQAARSGKKAQDRIRTLSATHEDDLQGVLNDGN